ncbi:efflux RND transporter permease subunit [Dyella caseinilytica]|uniref:Efflux RND transporter permease subunit n=1 Tax=Dyella caseinilytica TaxID=1849581 RepID=A0ABX7GUF2_9GAMM|nr:efflux RND transporter permease subunit [Dyella caseinilytica]QRN53683.1 efflux RND transporter permease subunit [Dyella caseinilytica]GFZ88494.1 acriflavin resistance protein [Dyella caseinilytica]
MNVFAPIIRRPVGTSLLAIGVIIAGICAYILLGLAAFPSLEFPGVMVAAQMSGASAQTMATTVTAPLERQLGRIPGIEEIDSDTSEGATQIQIMFVSGTNVDRAARDVQAAINAALPELPQQMASSPPQYFKFNTSQIPVLLLEVTSTSMAPDKLYDLADTFIKPVVSQISGVAQVQVQGGAPHAVRVSLNSAALTAKGLIANDVANALRAANVTSPQGVLSNGTSQITVTANDALQSASDFASLVIANQKGVPVYLSDVAKVESGQQDAYQAAWFNNQRAVTLNIAKRPEANAVAVVKQVKEAIPRLKAMLPADVQITPIFDLSTSTTSALHEVEIALLLSIVMVAFVMLVFLRRVRPTLIAMVSVPLSLAGAFVVMFAFGFTLNMLSLIALVLCIGFVVDDAIVVIENIFRHMERGVEPLDAALIGVREIGFTVISITLSLIAVFAPLLFGNNGLVMVMREFSVTLISTIIISAVVSLTLTPALCGRYLMQEQPGRHVPGRLEQLAERFDRWSLAVYERGLHWAMRHRRIMRWQPVLLLVLTVLLAVGVVKTAGGGFMPKSDSGIAQAFLLADANISPDLLAKRTQAVYAIILADPAVQDVASFLGNGNGGGGVGNQSSFFIDLKPIGKGPNDRHDSADAVVTRLSDKFKQFTDVEVSVTSLQLFGNNGSSFGGAKGQYAFNLTSNNGDPLQEPTLQLAREMRKMKQFRDVSTTFDSIGKQQMIEVDRNAASRMQVNMGQIDQVLFDAFGQTPVSTIYSDVNQYQVILIADNANSLRPETLLNLYVRNSQNKMVQLSAMAHIKPYIAPVDVQHYKQLEAASINYNLTDGVTQTDALKLIDVAMLNAQVPPGIAKQFTGDNQRLAEAGTNSAILLVAVILAMYIVLGILYESLIHPLTILSTLPAAGMGAFLAMLVTQTQLTTMSVIAVLMLIGIVKKNAILMVDFALVAEREGGRTPPEAILEAALVRFRPITMTTLVAMGAALPLAVGFGIGSEMRQPLGIAILGGLLVSQLLTLLSTPAIYLWQHDRRERKAKRQEKRRLRRLGKQVAATS